MARASPPSSASACTRSWAIMKLHKGTDFAAPIGTPIFAAGNGVVEWAAMKGPNGNLTILRHDNGWQTYYLHQSRFMPGIAPGARVAQGQQIGEIGTTGRSTGPHLHYEVHIDGQPVDPLSIQTEAGSTLTGAGAASPSPRSATGSTSAGPGRRAEPGLRRLGAIAHRAERRRPRPSRSPRRRRPSASERELAVWPGGGAMSLASGPRRRRARARRSVGSRRAGRRRGAAGHRIGRIGGFLAHGSAPLGSSESASNEPAASVAPCRGAIDDASPSIRAARS